MLVRALRAAALLTIASSPAFAHTDGVIEIRSSAPGGGALTASGIGDEPVHASLVFCSAGQCLYENDEGAIRAPATNAPAEDSYALDAGTALRLEIVSVDAGASIKVGSANLDQSGKSTSLGEAHSVHAHPIWRINAPLGETGTWRIAIRFTTTASQYEDSEDIEIAVTNHEHDDTTTTSSSTTSTSTTTLVSTTCGNAVIDPGEACDRGGEPWSHGRACGGDCQWLGCGDPDGDGETRASDALFVLSAAVGTNDCDPCLCNVDASAAPAISVADALRVLLYAVGATGEPLNCPVCGD